MWSSTGARLLMTTTLNGKLAGLFLNHDGIFYPSRPQMEGCLGYCNLFPCPILFLASTVHVLRTLSYWQQCFFVNSPLQEKCFPLCVLLTLLAVMGYLYCMKGYSKSRNDHFKSIWKAGKWAIIHIMLSIKMERFLSALKLLPLCFHTRHSMVHSITNAQRFWNVPWKQ